MSDTAGGGPGREPWAARVRRWYDTRTPIRASRGEMGPWEQKEALRARITELEAILHAAAVRASVDEERAIVADSYAAKAQHELEQANSALGHDSHPRMRRAAHLGVAQSHVDSAMNLMVWMASSEDIKAMLPDMLALIDEHFTPRDPRRIHATEIARRLHHDGQNRDGLRLGERAFLAETVSHARRLLRKETLRVRSFVGIVMSVTAGLFLAAIGVAVMSCIWETAIPLCFTPEISGGKYKVVCPSFSQDFKGPPTAEEIASTARAQDYLIIEIVGVLSAAIASAAALRRIRGTALPYNVPVVLALLKLPTGALTAGLGLLLMRGGFVPGLSALDSTAQIIAWAIIFGYSQQLFTKFVDNQGQAVLDAVRGPTSQAGSTGPHV
ncbi:putative membrane protein [Streptomyces davaonensis JCM 4913]|uniref:Putative membrane protein n=1 Tax=Streptomyces davaonensis (strain DSM 101723 / JCM 4913 / KCC S-0913 / 768) TaxID=1214101 RepID=K4QSN6_STRDJ|nr:hypothetical protein [Streptomyces davaonensis]CCK24966.1 putative membrane protein [Streptomyces davaonensis JCM 4913]